MAAGVFNITIEQGIYFETNFNLKDAAGAAINITSYDFKSEIRNKNDNSLVKTFTCAIVNGSEGAMKITMAGSDTADIPQRNLVYDLIAKDTANRYRRYLEGKVNVVDTVTSTAGL